MSIVHTEVIELVASPAKVKEFIMTPERILDYYPSPVEGGVLEPGIAYFCRGEMGVSLLERVASASNEDVLVLKVTTAIGLEAPYTRERIEANATFTMFEDWALAESGSGTKLTKSWRDIEAPGPEPFPLEETIKQSAIHESPQLADAWNRFARDEATN
ncbi:MAG: hypothetical protein AB8G23_10990 [Myxococcota bacterium]